MNEQSPVTVIHEIAENSPVLEKLASPLMQHVGIAKEVLPAFKGETMKPAKFGHVMLLDWMGSDDTIVQ